MQLSICRHAVTSHNFPQRHGVSADNKELLWRLSTFENLGIEDGRLLFCTMHKSFKSTHRRPAISRSFVFHVIGFNPLPPKVKTVGDVNYCGLSDRRSGNYSVGGPLEAASHAFFPNNNLDPDVCDKQVRDTVTGIPLINIVYTQSVIPSVVKFC